MYEKYHTQGLEILAFPCDQFLNQEPGHNDEILDCLKYVRPGGGFVPHFTDTLFQKIKVNGDSPPRAPIYAWLTTACGPASPVIGDPASYILWNPLRPGDITWNFDKFLIGKNGLPIKRYTSDTLPSELTSDIEIALRA